MSNQEPKPAITSDRQKFVDEPVMAWPKAESYERSTLDLSMQLAGLLTPPRKHEGILLGYERVRLRWLTPDANGKLKERAR